MCTCCDKHTNIPVPYPKDSFLYSKDSYTYVCSENTLLCSKQTATCVPNVLPCVLRILPCVRKINAHLPKAVHWCLYRWLLYRKHHHLLQRVSADSLATPPHISLTLAPKENLRVFQGSVIRFQVQNRLEAPQPICSGASMRAWREKAYRVSVVCVCVCVCVCQCCFIRAYGRVYLRCSFGTINLFGGEYYQPADFEWMVTLTGTYKMRNCFVTPAL